MSWSTVTVVNVNDVVSYSPGGSTPISSGGPHMTAETKYGQMTGKGGSEDLIKKVMLITISDYLIESAIRSTLMGSKEIRRF